MKTPIYFDFAATTPVDPRVAEKMMQFLTLDGQFGNPASRSHRFGWQAEEAVDIARNQVAQLVKADPREIVWTSGATESDNLAIKGVAEAFKEKGNHIITMTTEHKAVVDTCIYLEQKGWQVTWLTPDANGLVDMEALAQAITDKTVLVSIMQVNNETGVVQNIEAIGELCRQHKVLFHVDAAQAAGKLSIDLSQLPVDLMSFSAHKIYGPKGIGALYVRRSPDVSLEALIHGGGHERGMRSGTLATHQIVGMGEAFAYADAELEQEAERIQSLKLKLWQGLKDITGVSLNSSLDGAPGILNVSFAGVDGETLLMSLHQLAVSSGSACNSASVEPSYVLKAMGLSDELALTAIRFSVGRFTTEQEIDYAIEQVSEIVPRLQAL
ncbi:IscS subfamily cysteine desulfurase [Pleionea sp. CnH1-48]|uniref:IscS subfamily cysteine desulfurase n=1 Tax=Pleionea sp. CnH1-48 TaxID=2954494 RepID=UPI00209825AD|nr:IscS subfamily cysteine desulfurase [Pleionea sp. CnH1-48]MCO7226877.1 IscS subfamily cysteine desulfurase [Pleionea sp. CnH1-48]